MCSQQLFKTRESLISGNLHLVVWVAVGHGWLKLWKEELGSREAPSTAKSKGKWETETETQTNSPAGVLSCLSASFTRSLPFKGADSVLWMLVNTHSRKMFEVAGVTPVVWPLNPIDQQSHGQTLFYEVLSFWGHLHVCTLVGFGYWRLEVAPKLLTKW